MGRSALLFVTAAAVLSTPDIAAAGTANVVSTTPFSVVLGAGVGEYNDLTVERSSTYRSLTYSDANVLLTAGKGCSYFPTGEVDCQNPNASVDAYLAGGGQALPPAPSRGPGVRRQGTDEPRE
jgi:hypothetical protein